MKLMLLFLFHLGMLLSVHKHIHNHIFTSQTCKSSKVACDDSASFPLGIRYIHSFVPSFSDFFFFCHALSMWKFPGQGSNLHQLLCYQRPPLSWFFYWFIYSTIKWSSGVPVVTQQIKNFTRIHEDAGFDQWVKALLSGLRIWRCCKLQCRLKM